MMHGWGWSGGMGIGPGGGIVPLLIVTVLILGGFWVIRTIYRDRNDRNDLQEHRDDDGDARQILRQRYARGEVDREEFLAMKEDLG